MEIGIAAGTAAAMCAQRGETPRQLNIDDLRHALIEEMKVSLWQLFGDLHKFPIYTGGGIVFNSEI